MTRPPNLCVFFGGFLQEESTPESTDDPLGPFYEAHPTPGWTHQGQFWNGQNTDTLAKRSERALTLLRASRRPSVVSILGYSMGCHLAVRFACRCARLQIPIDRLILLAPDPKFKETVLDREPQERNAYREVGSLWRSNDPGRCFVAALRSVRTLRGMVFAYSKCDKIAQWRGNVEHLPRELGLDVERAGWFSKRSRDKHSLIFTRFRLNRLGTKLPTHADATPTLPPGTPSARAADGASGDKTDGTPMPPASSHKEPLDVLDLREGGAKSARTITLFRGDSIPPAGGGGVDHRGRTFADHFCGNGLMARYADWGRSRDMVGRDLVQIVLEHVGFDRGQEETYRADHSPLLSFSTLPDTGMRFANRRLKALEECNFEEATCFIWRFTPTITESNQPGAYFFRYQADPKNCRKLVGEKLRRGIDRVLAAGDDLAFGKALGDEIALKCAGRRPDDAYGGRGRRAPLPSGRRPFLT